MGKGKKKAKKKQGRNQQNRNQQVKAEPIAAGTQKEEVRKAEVQKAEVQKEKAQKAETQREQAQKEKAQKAEAQKEQAQKAEEQGKEAKNPKEAQQREEGMQQAENAQSQEQAVKPFPWKKFWLICAGSAAGILLAIYIGGMVYLNDKFQPNTMINGIDASLDTVAEAEQKIADMAETYEISLEERGGSEETITAEQVGYHYVSKGEVQGFQKRQKLYLWPVSLWQPSEYKFVSSTAFSEEELEETVSGLNCFDEKVETAPTDAYMKFNGTTYEMVKETQGQKVRKKKLIKVLSEAIAESEEEVSLETEGCYAKPKITEKNKLLNKTIANLNSYAKTRIVYKFGAEQELLDGSIISKWLTYDEKGNVTLDEEKVALYVDYLASRYDTSGKAREFVTHGGNTVLVEGGSYGWLIDKEAETAELTEMIRAGKRRTRVPVYAQTAVSRENSDLGEDYVEIDLSNQHLWMYIGGKEIVSTDMVSGTYTNSSRRTPPGTYTLYYKKSPAVLRGYTPGDTYESHVTYWMPFNGGIGLHDANWRGSFGGNIFKYSGSHGCINLPTSAAKEIYNNIYAGMPIICYY